MDYADVRTVYIDAEDGSGRTSFEIWARLDGDTDRNGAGEFLADELRYGTEQIWCAGDDLEEAQARVRTMARAPGFMLARALRGWAREIADAYWAERGQ